MKHFIISILFVGAFGAFYYFEIRQPAPCEEPVTYSIGTFDRRFGLTERDFLDDISRAEKVWSILVGKELFTYKPTGGDLTINLIYDERQQSTDKLEEIQSTISVSRASYDALNAKYSSMHNSYVQDKANIEKMIATYQAASDVYRKKVSYWNQKGGAPKAEYQKLEREQAALNAQAAQIREAQSLFNTRVAELNATGEKLNALAKKLNINVATYNTVGESLGREFEEGEYINNIINVYQFSDDAKLQRLLAHELGHALGLDHVQDPYAIMYYLNTSSQQTATEDDVQALKALCKL